MTLLNDILDLSKIEAGKIEIEMEPVNLATLFNAVQDAWLPLFDEKGLTLDFDVDTSVAQVVSSDPTRIRQILFNLVGNAFKFTQVGEVRVRLRQKLLENCACELFAEITDTGIGIAQDAGEQLFDAFTQADTSTTREYGGSGLGLAISKRFTQLLGGDIGFDSKLGEGSRFWFTLRCELIDAGHAASDPAESVEPFVLVLDRPVKVLCAEDNKVNQIIIKGMLQANDIPVDFVQDGEAAVRAVQASQYDIVLMDVNMPVMDGVKATTAIRSLNDAASYLPIIGLTANAMNGDRERYLSAGMDAYVTKPIDAPELLRALALCLSPGAAPRATAPNILVGSAAG
jgi:CheY-like chemotaxis protein